MTGGGNGVVLIQQNRGSGKFGPYATTNNHIHDNIIVDHDSTGKIGGRSRLQMVRHGKWRQQLDQQSILHD